MKTTAVAALVLLSFVCAGAQADERINFCKDMTTKQFHDAAKYAFKNRGYQVEDITPTAVTASLRGKTVEMVITVPGQIVIRYKEGSERGRDQWLRNLKTDVLWELTE